ncbi:MAG TPA: type II secretion system protein GspG [Phycisphaerae bacterium]|nr:type II secretion system protein GspG [Phycisphaerae bacterium]
MKNEKYPQWVVACCLGIFTATFSTYVLTGRTICTKETQTRAAIGPYGPLSGAIQLFRHYGGEWPSKLIYLYESPPEAQLRGKWRQCIACRDNLLDPWNQEYRYTAPGIRNTNGFDLWSIGPDGIGGSDDDIVNWE